jgi:hypothetical protein
MSEIGSPGDTGESAIAMLLAVTDPFDFWIWGHERMSEKGAVSEIR